MKIVHLSHHDVHGGAARAAYGLHSALLKAKIDSRMLVSVKHSPDPSVIEIMRKPQPVYRNLQHYARGAAIRASFYRYRSNLPRDFEIFSDDRSPYGRRLLSYMPPAHILNLHWVAGFLDQGLALPALSQLAPVVWRMSDLNPFTGGCHYNGGCKGFEKACGSCPQLGSHDPGDLSNRIWKRKEKAFRKMDPDRLRIVTLNRWMEKEVRKSSLFNNFQITVIPNGIDLDRFTPADRYASRKDLGIPDKARVIIFIADKVANPRKGLAGLIEALDGLSDIRDLFLLTIGRSEENIKLSFPHAHLGYLADQSLLSRAYSSADLYVHSAIQDNQPNTVLEAMACCLPVVAYNSGGLSEIVLEGQTGCLVPPNDVAVLSESIRSILEDRELAERMGLSGRDRASSMFSRDIQIKRYLEVYEEMLTSAGSRF